MSKLKQASTFTPFLVTGMARSGTTLLDKLLASHEQTIAFSQPLPWLYRHLKTVFYQQESITAGRYVLNDLFNESSYSPEMFRDFLGQYSLSRQDLQHVFTSMEGWSGRQYKDYDTEKLIDLGAGSTLIEFYSLFLNLVIEENNKTLLAVGTKEILIEEYIPYFSQSGVKSIVIIRDPRDVITSLNVGAGSQYGGGHRPTLFHLRNWRKSIAVANAFQSDVLLVKYEDLLGDTYQTLTRITSFLGVDAFPNAYFDTGIRDINGEQWAGNSSTGTHKGINHDNIGKFEQYLTSEMIGYIEYFCRPEMNLLGYPFTLPPQLPTCFQEQFEVGEYGLSPTMSTNPEELELEMHRLRLVEAGACENQEQVSKLFYNQENFDALIKKI